MTIPARIAAVEICFKVLTSNQPENCLAFAFIRSICPKCCQIKKIQEHRALQTHNNNRRDPATFIFLRCIYTYTRTQQRDYFLNSNWLTISMSSEDQVRCGGGGGGAGALIVRGWYVGGGARGTRLKGGGMSVSRSCLSSAGGAEAAAFRSSPSSSFSWVSRPGLRSSQILFIQSIVSCFTRLIQHPPRWYYKWKEDDIPDWEQGSSLFEPWLSNGPDEFLRVNVWRTLSRDGFHAVVFVHSSRKQML